MPGAKKKTKTILLKGEFICLNDEKIPLSKINKTRSNSIFSKRYGTYSHGTKSVCLKLPTNYSALVISWPCRPRDSNACSPRISFNWQLNAQNIMEPQNLKTIVLWIVCSRLTVNWKEDSTFSAATIRVQDQYSLPSHV